MRWVRDRDLQYSREVRGAVNSAGPQIYGALNNQLHSLALATLHEYRDRASASVRAYKRLARSEGVTHRLARLRRVPPEPLTITSQGHLILAGWRHMESPVPGNADITIKPGDDPVLSDATDEAWPLEQEPGVTWNAARQSKAAKITGKA